MSDNPTTSRLLYSGVTIPKGVTNTVVYPRIQERSRTVVNKETKKRAFSIVSGSTCESISTSKIIVTHNHEEQYFSQGLLVFICFNDCSVVTLTHFSLYCSLYYVLR